MTYSANHLRKNNKKTIKRKTKHLRKTKKTIRRRKSKRNRKSKRRRRKKRIGGHGSGLHIGPI